MRRIVIVALAGCGRLDFDTVSDAELRPPDATSDLVAHYTMDSLAGMSVPDSGDNHLHAACTSCPTQDIGVLGGALRFDGTSTVVSVASPLFDQTIEYTVAFWARRDQLPQNASCMVGKVYGTTGLGNSWQICINSIGVIFYSNWNGTTNDDTTPGNAVDAMWHHFAIAWQPPSEVLYLDGAEVFRITRAKPFDSGPVVIGADIDSGVPLAFYSGWIDDVRIYNRPLAATEIAALAQ